MNDKTGGSRGLRRAGALAVAAAVTVLATACGAHVSTSGGSASTGSAVFRANLAYAHCMQTHGLPDFPDPNPSQGFSMSGQLSGNPSGNSPVARANNACKHLLPRGSTSTGSGVTQAQLALAVKVAQCLRAHGEPNFPDPTVVNGSLHFTLQRGVLQSAQFQTALNACRSLIPKGVKFP